MAKEDYAEAEVTEDVSERGGCQQSGGVGEVVDAAERQLGRIHVEVDHGVHGDGDRVPREDLLQPDVRCTLVLVLHWSGDKA